LGKQTSEGIFHRQLLVILTDDREHFHVDASGVFFRACSWKN
jgi:hypothetical protein